MEGAAWSRGSGWGVAVSKVLMGAEVAEVSKLFSRDEGACKIAAFKVEEAMPDWPFEVKVALFCTTAASYLQGVCMLVSAYGIAQTLDLGGGDNHGPVLSLCAGSGQAAGEVGLSPAAPEAGAAWQLATQQLAKGKKPIG